MTGISTDRHGNMYFDGPEAVSLFRLRAILHGMRLELRSGMRLTRKAPSCFTIARREFGLRGNKEKILSQFEQYVEKISGNMPIWKE